MSNNNITFELSEPQKRIWYTQMIHPDSSMFNIGGWIRIHGEINLALLEKAVLLFLKSHDVFQIRLTSKDGEPRQYFCDSLPEKIEYKNFNNVKNNEEIFNDWIEKKALLPFELEDCPLYEFILYSLNNKAYGYYLKLHHIIADGWSIQILTNEISKYYSMLLDGDEPKKFSSIGYKDFIMSNNTYLMSEKYKKDKIFWSSFLEKLPELRGYSSSSIKGNRRSFCLSNSNMEHLHDFCKKYAISKNAFFVSLYILYINKISGKTDIIIGNPVLGRSGKKEKMTIGMYVSTMPFRYKIIESKSVLDMIKDINSSIKKCFMHQKYPYNHLVKDLDIGNTQLYRACVNYYKTTMCKEFDESPVDNEEFYNGEQQYDLQIIIREWSDEVGIQFDVDYKISEFQENQIEDMIFRFEILMDIIFTNHDREIKDICLLADDERKLLVVDYNDTNTSYIPDENIIDMFKKQVTLNPDFIAVQDGDKKLSYKKLDELSNNLARFLKTKKVNRNTVVGLFTIHSIETVIAILGILKSQGAYLPIDVNCPIERLSFMLKDAAVEILLTNIEDIDDVKLPIEIFNLNDRRLYEDKSNETCLDESYQMDKNIAYVIYTSGSTGKPKGVIVEHLSLANYITWAKKQYIKLDKEILPLYTSLSFDLTVTTLFLPLISGGTLCVYRDDEDEYVLKRILKDDICTIVKITPAHLVLIKEYNLWPMNMHSMIVGGENLKSDLARDIYDGFEGRVIIYNEYGPTEATVGCMIYKFDSIKNIKGSVPIGKPISNCKIYVLDKNFNPLPVGVSGELYISGRNTARGYMNQVELTYQKFVSKRFMGNDEVFYKSGDIVKFIDHNTIEYCGREDYQVKIRGFRVEISEIESCISEFPGVEGSVVINLQEKDGSSYLCAYYVSKFKIIEDEIKRFLVGKLLSYMIPKYIIQIGEIPLTNNGKVDRAKLPLPCIKFSGKQDNIINEKERTFISIIKNILGKDNIQMADNFYHMGGDSIKAIQISSRVNDSGYKIKVKDILDNPLLSDMLLYLNENKKEYVSQNLCSGNIKATPIIQWFSSQKLNNLNSYCQVVSLKLNHHIPVGILEKILINIVRQHDVLRLSWDMNKENLFYNNEYLKNPIVVKEWDMKELEEDELIGEVYQKQILLSQEFDIAKGLLLRSGICISKKMKIWCIAIHHLAIDGISWRIIFEDMQMMMKQYIENRQFKLPMKTNSYQEWAELQPNSAENIQFKYYINNGNTIFQAKDKEIVSNKCIKKILKVDKETTYSIMYVANEAYHTNPVELIISALISILPKICNINDIRLEIESHGRNLELGEIDISRTVGWFTNILCFPITDISDNIAKVISYVKENYRNIVKKGGMENLNNDGKEVIRFNFLGEYHTDYDFFTVYSDINNENELTADMEIDAILLKKQLQVLIRTNDVLIKDFEGIERFSSDFLKQLENITYHCLNDEVDTNFIPSDFDSVDITQEDLDMLFE